MPPWRGLGETAGALPRIIVRESSSGSGIRSLSRERTVFRVPNPESRVPRSGLLREVRPTRRNPAYKRGAGSCCVAPVVQEIVERARTHVGNLAHALKTPLAVITNEARASHVRRNHR